MSPSTRICILTREPTFRKTLERLAHQHGFQIHTGADLNQLDQLLLANRIEALVMELPPSAADKALRIERLRASGPDTVLIGISADPRPELAAQALRAGLDDYLRKPFNAEELFERIGAALKRRQRQRALQDGHAHQQITIEKLSQALEERAEELMAAMKALKEERLLRRTTQVALRRSEAKFNELLDTSPDLIYILDHHGRFRYVSPSVGRLLGISENELIGHHFSALLPTDHLPRAQYHFRERRTRQRATRFYEIHLIHKHHRVPEDAEAFPRFQLFASGIYTPSGNGTQTQYIGTCGIAREVSRMQSLEHRLLRTEEAALMGQLALSASRRLHSPLQGVLSLLAALDKQNADPTLSSKEVRLLQSGIGQIGHIAKQMDSLQLPNVRRRERLDLTLLVAETIELLRSELQYRKIFCEYRLAPEPLPVFADRTQLRQLVTILVNNALDALSDRYGPRQSKERNQLLVFTDRQNGEALVRICNNGPGLRRQDLPYLFEPFFSRKPQAGAGLGLYLAKGIVTSHGGHILAANNARGDAVFSVHLPLVMPHLVADE
jgi:PAS domain S-box-containing protein